MSTAQWASRLLSFPRHAGCVTLSALDVAARQLVVTQYMKYTGELSAVALEAGLVRAVLQYPVVLGWIDDSAAADGTVLLCWDSHDQSRLGFDLSFQSSSTDKCPSIYSNWELWRAGAIPHIKGRMAAAKVTTYPAVNTSILVFSFDHALFDYGASYRFLQLWLEEAAAIAAAGTAAALNCTSVAPSICSAPATAEVLLRAAESAGAACKVTELPSAVQASAVSMGWETAAAGNTDSNTVTSPSSQAAVVQGLPYCSRGMFSRSCFFDRPWWTLPKSRHDCMEWILQHNGSECPFKWNPLDPADNCLQGLKGILHGSDSQFSVWRIPSAFLKRLKAIAETAQPLPAGLWYSASSAAAAILVATLYEAAPETARRLGGLHATTVVDLRGGRCGLDIPDDSMTNASVSGIRVWVPTQMLDDAASSIQAAAVDGGGVDCLGGVCKLMHHIRTDLQRQLQDETGVINKQFEWFEAARRAAVPHQVGLCQGLLQYDAGDIVLDWLPPAAQLPSLPGTKLTASSVRMLSSYMDRIVMAMPVPQENGEPGYAMQFEVSLPRKRTPPVYKTWTRLGFEAVAVPAQQGSYLGALDGLVYPYSSWLMLKNTVGCLPWLILRLWRKMS